MLYLKSVQSLESYILQRKDALLLLAFMLVLVLMSCYLRYLTPVNETLYAGVAWDMWSQHHVLIPMQNGHTYLQKPPLFFWLVHFGWLLFGVHQWWLMALPSLCTLGSIYLTMKITQSLLQQKCSGMTAGWILAGMLYWSYYAPRVRLDQLLTLCIMLSLFGLSRTLAAKRYGWLLFTIGNGLALLTKGPICFIFTLIPAVIAIVFFKRKPLPWLRNLSISIMGSVAILSLWAIPVIINDPVYAKSILWDQTIQRLQGTVEVQSGSWYYYFIRLPLLILPWTLWPALWKKSHLQQHHMKYWLALSILTIFCILSFVIHQKASRFLLPLLPFIAILCASFKLKLSHVRIISCGSLCMIILYYLISIPIKTFAYDMSTIGKLIQNAQAHHHPVAFIGNYYDDRFQFPGRIIQPITELKNKKEIQTWQQQHPDGLIIQTQSQKIKLTQKPLYQQPYRHGQRVVIWLAASL